MYLKYFLTVNTATYEEPCTKFYNILTKQKLKKKKIKMLTIFGILF